MNYEQIIERKINYLNNDNTEDLDDEMLELVAKDKNLMQELEFIQQFWSSKEQATEQLPSSDLSNNFYQMLDKAKTAQHAKTHQQQKSGIFQFLENLFTGKPVLQYSSAFATLLTVFTFGYYLNEPITTDQNQAMANLQKEVKSLNSMVALSMIQKSTATERLTGVAYSKISNNGDETLTMALIELLNSDSSTAVRLAVIDAVKARSSVVNLQKELLTSIPQQPNALVQMGLIRLIFDKGNESGRTTIMNMTKEGKLEPEVSQYLTQLNQTDNI